MTIRQALHEAADLIADAIEAELYGAKPRRRAKTIQTEKSPPKLRVIPNELQRAKARQILGLVDKRGEP
jgi:hypothetical protein